jgi:hypothetical protein
MSPGAFVTICSVVYFRVHTIIGDPRKLILGRIAIEVGGGGGRWGEVGGGGGVELICSYMLLD